MQLDRMIAKLQELRARHGNLDARVLDLDLALDVDFCVHVEEGNRPGEGILVMIDTTATQDGYEALTEPVADVPVEVERGQNWPHGTNAYLNRLH